MDSNEHGPAAGAAPPPPRSPVDGAAAPPPRAPGIAGLSTPYRVVTALALGAIAVAACAHLGLVFLHVAPANTVSKQHARTIDGWIYPEFEQNWKLFAPNPLQQNIAVEARAEVRTAGGELITTDWRDLSAQDGAAIRHSLLPSHTEQNELRRAWDFFTGSHDEDNMPNGERGELSEAYLLRIAVNRLAPEHRGGQLLRVQLRSATTAVPAPKWSTETTDTRTYYRELPWWTV